MFKTFIGLTLAIAIAVGIAMPAHRRAPAAKMVERDAPVDRQDLVIQRDANGHFFANGTVNGQPVHFLVDTGTTAVALTAEDASRIGLPFDPAEFHQVARSASGPVFGKDVVFDRVALGQKEVSDVRGVIIANGSGVNVSLLGQTYLERIGSVQLTGSEMVIR